MLLYTYTIILLRAIVSCYSRSSVTLSVGGCCSSLRPKESLSPACVYSARVSFARRIICARNNNHKNNNKKKKGCTRVVRTMCPPIVSRIYAYTDTAAAARDSAEIITNVYISIIFPLRENPSRSNRPDNDYIDTALHITSYVCPRGVFLSVRIYFFSPEPAGL